MMPVVTMPDGQSVTFPDDMPRDEIRDLILQKFPELAGGDININGQMNEAGAAQAGMGEGLMRAAGRGATVGLMDHIVAAGSAAAHPLVHGESGLDFNERRKQYLSRERGKFDEFEEDNRVASGAAQIGGGLATLIPAAGTRLGAQALGITGKNLATRSAASAGSGAALGGVHEALTGGDPVTGAATGAALGLGIPVAGSVIGAGVRKGLSAFPGKSSQAGNMATRAMADDAITPVAARAKLSTMGDDAMLADLGPNLTQQTGGIASIPGSGQKVVRDALQARQTGAGGRISSTLDDAFGSPANLRAEREGIIAARKANISPLYEAAKKYPGSLNPAEAVQIITRLKVNAVGKKAAALENIETMLGGPFKGKMLFEMKSTAADLHEVRVEISRAMRNEWRDIAGGVRPVLKAIDDQLDKVSGYAKARSGWALSKDVEAALDQGRTIFKRSVRPDDLSAELAAMSGPEREAFRRGARDVVAEIMGTARNDAGAAWREIAEKGWNREKLRMILGKKSADKVLHRLGNEKIFAATANRVTQNSETAARQAAQRELQGRGLPNEPITIFGRAFESVPLVGPLVRGGVQKALSALKGKTREQVNLKLAKLLTATGAERDKAIDAVANILSMTDEAISKGDVAKLLTQTTLISAQSPMR